MQITEEKILEKIKDQFSIRLTEQRRLILRILVENQNQHLSAKEVHSLAQERNNKVGLATVYRTLNLLSEKGVLAKRKFNQDTTLYEWDIDNSILHYHLVCKKCGKVIEKEGNLNLQELATENDFHPTDCWIEVEGYCQDCR